PLLRFAVSATGGAHLCSIQYYLRFWLGICRTSLAVSALRIMRYCLKFCLCLRNIRHFLCFLIHLKEKNAWNLKRQPLSARWNTDPLRLKKLTAEREDAIPMAHLFDMDY
ncbi:MAG: hypothetical protein SOX66_00080, partial [Gemmiger qucibialis]|nr:hypothetical protein [Gemmiger qucibialis]